MRAASLGSDIVGRDWVKSPICKVWLSMVICVQVGRGEFDVTKVADMYHTA
jgi:hypothetical protein